MDPNLEVSPSFVTRQEPVTCEFLDLLDNCHVRVGQTTLADFQIYPNQTLPQQPTKDRRLAAAAK